MSTPAEFHYRLPRRTGSWRPGSHPASSVGAGQEFVSHASLYERADPRRLDLRASLRDLHGRWLVRVTRQRASVPIHVVVDVSASMAFGTPTPKLQIVADFVESLGRSAFRAGDPVGLIAFDTRERRDLFMPALLSRGAGTVMAELLRAHRPVAGGIQGLESAAIQLAGREGLIFLASDFHWPLNGLSAVLDLFASAYVVPMIVWDRAEIEPPADNGLARLRDAESGAQRTLWLRPTVRNRWRESVDSRRRELHQLFVARGLRPFPMVGRFDADALSQYFLSLTA